MHLGDRECSIQRRNQKLVEIAPSPWLIAELARAHCRRRHAARRRRALRQSRHVRVPGRRRGRSDDAWFAFIEANPRLQVEHTVTEEVTGLDLVQAADSGRRRREARGTRPRTTRARRAALRSQARVNLEDHGRRRATPRPSGGRIAAFEMPSGPGVRVERFGYAGYRTSAAFDSLHGQGDRPSHAPDFSAAAAKAARALGEFRIAGVATNIAFLQALLTHPDFVAGRIDTRFVERRLPELLKAASQDHRRL